MKITKDKETLVLNIPIVSDGQPIVVGVIAGDEYTLSHLIYLDYKDNYQEGMPIIHFDTREELEKICKESGIDIWEHPLCAYCHEPIRGSFTLDEKGKMCYGCELDKNI